MGKKVLSIVLVLCLVLSLAACKGSNNTNNAAPVNNTVENTNETNNTNNADNSGNTAENNEELQGKFAEFVDKQYKYAIEESYSSAHVYYLDPAKAGLNEENIEKSFGLAPNDEDYEETRTYYADLKKELESFDREKLTRRQQDEYDTIEWEINSVLAMSDKKFDYYDQLFAPPNSLDANIVGLLSTWEIRNEKDANDFVTLINSLPAYVDSAIEYAKKQQEKKLFMTDFDAVVTGCDDVINGGMNSFIITRILKQVDDIEGLSAEKKSSCKAAINDAFAKSYLPSFSKIKEGINSLRNGYNNEEGYAAFPNGAEYFEALLNYTMGSYGVSCEDFKSEIEKRTNKIYSSLSSIVLTNKDAIDHYYDTEHNNGYTSYQDMLEAVKVQMLEDHPEVKNLDYHIELADAEEKLDEKNVAAYFVIPPLDGDHKQQMRVNPSNDDMASLDTYMTVTHEGFPGHMYQYAYLYDLDISDYLKTIGVDGMVEGYAVYAQYGSLNYLKDLDKNDAAIAAMDNRLSYLMYCTLDIGINYEGWSIEDTKKYFDDNDFGLEDDVVKEIYDFLRCSPVTYEPYGLGYEFIAAERERAEKALGDKFSAKAFNQAFLNAASAPRSVVTRYIDEYIDSAK